MPTKGKVNGVVILVEFADKSFTDRENANQYYQDFFNKSGFNDLNSNGSVRDYFLDNSMGVFDPQFDVFGPVTLNQNESYYGGNLGIDKTGNDRRPYEMIIDACQLLDEEIDFSKYDFDGDDYIDGVYVIYAGEGENADPTQTDLIWPHRYSVVSASSQRIKLDGKTLSDYVCTCELYKGIKDGIGTFCHEFCNMFGLQDSYYTPESSAINGDYDIMDSGTYLGSSEGSTLKEGRCPCALNAYQRYELGWLNPEPLIPNKYNGDIRPRKDTVKIDDHLSQIITVYDTIPIFCMDTLPNMTTTNRALLFSVNTTTDDPRDGEYYIFENRQQTSWDSHLPNHGMLVWHIDYVPSLWKSGSINRDKSHPCVQLVKARPLSSWAGATFPGSPREVNTFSATTTPAFLGWDQRGTGSGKTQSLSNIALTAIKEGIVKSVSNTFNTITFECTDDGPDHLYPGGYTDIEQIEQDEWLLYGNEKSSHPRRIWRDGQLLIETPSGLYDLQGHRIE